MGTARSLAIFIHGAGGGGWEWTLWAAVFEAEGWKGIAEDLHPAEGGIATTRFADYLAQVEEWAAQHESGRLVLIGASMGGILALKAAETVKPDAIMLVNSLAPRGLGPQIPKQWPDVVEWSKGSFEDSRLAMPDSDEETIQFAHARWRDESGAVLREIAAGIDIEPPTCPLLVIVGDKDEDVPPETGTKIAQRLDGDLMLCEEVSHVGPLLGRRAGEIAEHAVTWLTEHLR